MRMVSAIITTHDRIALLKRAVQSVFSQTYKDIELIVVDDASSDGTQNYCESEAGIRYIRIPAGESRGGNYARNLGIKVARGEYVAFLDDDDAWLPEKIAKQVALMEQMDCELVYCGRRLEIVQDGSTSYRDNFPSSEYWGDMNRKILLAICTTTSAILCRKKALYEVGLFDEELRFWQEYELTIRLAQRKPFYFVNEPLIIYRVDCHDKNRLTNKFYEWKEAVCYIHEKHKDLYKTLSITERWMVDALVYRDGAARLDNCGMTWTARGYRMLGRSCSLPYRVLRRLYRIQRRKGHRSHRQ